MNKIIKNNDELMNLLDDLLSEKTSEWWNEFYHSKGDKIPFYTNNPDENLVEFCEQHEIKPRKALDIGCGIGRNTRYLSKISEIVNGCDISGTAIEEAEKRSRHIPNVKYFTQSIFDHDDCNYDFIYDSGCLHHMPPHIRYRYLEYINSILDDEGYFSLVCFNDIPGEGMTDLDVYIERSMKGGMLYSREKLTEVLEPYFEILEFRKMREDVDSNLLGFDFNWVVLMKKKISIV